MPSHGTKTQPDSKRNLAHFRDRYADVDYSKRGECEDRAAHHATTLEDWHPHRKKAAD